MRLTVVVALGALFAGCRACDDGAPPGGNVQPPMPTGMLSAPREATAPLSEDVLARLRASRTAQPGWVELAPGGTVMDESRWVSLTALSLMENAFARAQPGFGPFGARDVQPESMARLASELRAQRAEWLMVHSIAEAKAKWPAVGALHDVQSDAQWRSMRDAFVLTLEDVAAHVDRLTARSAGMRVGEQ